MIKVDDQKRFQGAFGLDVKPDETILVAEYNSDRIVTIATEGESIGTFGEEGSDIGQFASPVDVKISPDSKVYVADSRNHRVQVFHPDWTISHVIDSRVSGDGSFSRPQGLAFDLSGNVHITGYELSPSVSVFTPDGEFVCQYGTATTSPTGIAIDPSGYSLVMSKVHNGTLSIFDNDGTFVNSITGFRLPSGVSVSPDGGSIWVADTHNGRLVKYLLPIIQ